MNKITGSLQWKTIHCLEINIFPKLSDYSFRCLSSSLQLMAKQIKHVYGHANEFCLVEGQSSLMGPFEDSFQYA